MNKTRPDTSKSPTEHSDTALHSCPVTRVNGTIQNGVIDQVVVEAPLTIVLHDWHRGQRRLEQIAMTMRTPGEDGDLALGLLRSEGLIHNWQEVEGIETVHQVTQDNAPGSTTLTVILKQGRTRRSDPSQQRGPAHSSCGICSRLTPDAIRLPPQQHAAWPSNAQPMISLDEIRTLIDALPKSQHLFQQTGGLHAASIACVNTMKTATHEDIGRHNALDKLVGRQLRLDQLPLDNAVLLMSGRTSYEIMHKAYLAGIRIVVGVGAASSLAVEFAQVAQMALLGFARRDRLTIYAGQDLLAGAYL